MLAVVYQLLGVDGREINKIVQRTSKEGLHNLTSEGRGMVFTGTMINTALETIVEQDSEGNLILTHRASDKIAYIDSKFDESRALEEGVPVESAKYRLTKEFLNGGGRAHKVMLHDLTITTAIGKAANDPAYA